MRAVGLVGDQAPAVEAGAGAHPVGTRGGGAHDHRPAHAITGGGDPALLVDFLLRIEPVDEGLAVAHRRLGRQRRAPDLEVVGHGRLLPILSRLDERRLRTAIELVDHQHGVTAFGQPPRHLLERGPQPHDVGPDQHGRMLTLGRRDVISVAVAIRRLDRHVARRDHRRIGRAGQQGGKRGDAHPDPERAPGQRIGREEILVVGGGILVAHACSLLKTSPPDS